MSMDKKIVTLNEASDLLLSQEWLKQVALLYDSDSEPVRKKEVIVDNINILRAEILRRRRSGRKKILWL